VTSIVDNTFATPFCQRPLKLGADIVVHSLTKNICGFGTDMGGAVISSRDRESSLLLYRKDFGGVLSPKNAWPILVYGLPSLELRLRKEEQNALEVARFLEGHPRVKRVAYPGLESFPQRELAHRQMTDFDGTFAPSNMIYFALKGGDRAASRLVNYCSKHAYVLTLAVSLGQIRTLIEKPTGMTHSALPPSVKKAGHLDPGGVRLSIGIEDAGDIIHDLREALRSC
jgi:cystathionine beta-lyase/cystathionine gamma-synthase